MAGLKKNHALLIGLALLTGVGVAMVGSAEEYDEVATVADGVYLLQGEENRFRVSAQDAEIGVLVYGVDGDLVLGKTLDAGDDRTFVLTDNRAIVALFGGEAVLESTGDGDVTKVPVDKKRFKLLSGHGDAVDTTITVQLPDMLVGVSGFLDGFASEDLTITATTEKGVVFSATGYELADISRQLAVEALDAGTIDVSISASNLDGDLFMVLAKPRISALDEIRAHTHQHHMDKNVETAADEEAAEEPELLEAIPIHAVQSVPVAFDLKRPATLALDIEGGYILDLSIYDDEGALVAYEHRGMGLAEARTGCHDFAQCAFSTYHRESVAPEEIEVPLEPGSYILFVRAGAVEGDMTLAGVDAVAVFEAAEVLEVNEVQLVAGSEVDLTEPIVDLWSDDWSTDIGREVVVSINEETAYYWRSLASAFGASAATDVEFHPETLEAGIATMEVSGLSAGMGMDDATVYLFTVGDVLDEDLHDIVEEHADDEDEDDEDDDDDDEDEDEGHH